MPKTHESMGIPNELYLQFVESCKNGVCRITLHAPKGWFMLCTDTKDGKDGRVIGLFQHREDALWAYTAFKHLPVFLSRIDGPEQYTELTEGQVQTMIHDWCPWIEGYETSSARMERLKNDPVFHALVMEELAKIEPVPIHEEEQ